MKRQFCLALGLLLLTGCATQAPVQVSKPAPKKDPSLRPRMIGIQFDTGARSAVPVVNGSPTPVRTGLKSGRVALLQQAGRNLEVVVYDLAQGRILPQKPIPTWLGPGAPHVSADGRFLTYVTQGAMYSRAVLWNIDTAQEEPLPGLERTEVRDPDLSADGRYMVYVTGPQATPKLALYDRQVAATSQLQVPDALLFDAREPTLSGDASTLAWVAPTGRGDSNIYLLDLRTKRPLSPASLSTSDQEMDPALSMDGHTLLFTSDRNGTLDLFAYDLVANRYRDMGAFDTLEDESQPRFVGTAQEAVAYVSTSSGGPALYLGTLQGGR